MYVIFSLSMSGFSYRFVTWTAKEALMILSSSSTTDDFDSVAVAPTM